MRKQRSQWRVAKMTAAFDEAAQRQAQDAHVEHAEPPTTGTTKPPCKLVGTDGNVFALAARVRTALKRAGQHDHAAEMQTRLFQCQSYDEALRLCMEYVEATERLASPAGESPRP